MEIWFSVLVVIVVLFWLGVVVVVMWLDIDLFVLVWFGRVIEILIDFINLDVVC